MKRETLQPAYVLHRRAYQETSCLIDVFTEQLGRLTVLARGVRKQRSQNSGLLQPFTPLLLSWAGRGELVTLTGVELAGAVTWLQGENLVAGFYLNELIMALLQKWDAHPTLFQHYTHTLHSLKAGPLQAAILRTFEMRLLEQLGYGLLPVAHEDMSQYFACDTYYRFLPEHGFMTCLAETNQDGSSNFLGRHLIAMAKAEWDAESLQAAKRLMRQVLLPLLGPKQIHSRRLFLS